MKHAALLALSFVLLAGMGGEALAQQGDERILAAREALAKGDRDVLEALALKKEHHPLDAYVEFWRLQNVLARRNDVPPLAPFERFLSDQAGTILAERLRETWLRRLAEDGDWPGVVHQFERLASPDRDVSCHYLNARWLLGDRGMLDDALSVWNRDGGLVEACQPVLTTLVVEGRVGVDDTWLRFRRAMEGKRKGAARFFANLLPAAQAPATREVDAVLRDPGHWLDRLPVNFSITRRGRELAMAALAVLARSEPEEAHGRFQRLFDRFKSEERAYLYGNLAWRAAEAHLPQAIDWYRAAGGVEMSDEQYAWRVRAALRQSDWPAVRRAIEALPASMQSDPAWIYWLGRAMRAGGDEINASYQFARIADDIDFYGLLAAEELGRGFSVPATSEGDRAAARKRALEDAGLRRALALFGLDMRFDAVREWNWALRGADDDFLLAAAELAAGKGIYDRAITTAELARGRTELDLRYVVPYRELVEPQAKAQGLDLAWVYGLMRQESRFVPAARSSAGAQGLMQVMPSTGRWVAGKIGVSGYNLSWLREPENNVMIGTSYMRMVMDGLDNHPVLASAGYNAGPGRARRWRDQHPLEGAIYAETIPFDETRNYVKRVMANAVIYGALFERRVQSLKQRLGTVQPAN